MNCIYRPSIFIHRNVTFIWPCIWKMLGALKFENVTVLEMLAEPSWAIIFYSIPLFLLGSTENLTKFSTYTLLAFFSFPIKFWKKVFYFNLWIRSSSYFITSPLPIHSRLVSRRLVFLILRLLWNMVNKVLNFIM